MAWLSRVQGAGPRYWIPVGDGCVGRRRVHDKSNGAERGGVHGNDVTRVPARDLAEHWIGGDERRVIDRPPPPSLPPREAPVERVVVNGNRRAKNFSLPAMC